MSDKLTPTDSITDVLLQTSIKLDELVEAISDIAEAQAKEVIEARMMRGCSKEQIAQSVEAFQTFMALMSHLVEGIVHLFDGYVLNSMSAEEVTRLFTAMMLTHDQRNEGLVSNHFNSEGMMDKMLSDISKAKQDEYGPN